MGSFMIQAAWGIPSFTFGSGDALADALLYLRTKNTTWIVQQLCR